MINKMIIEKEGWKVNPKPLEIDEVPAKDLLLIHQLVYNYKNKLLDQMQTELTKFPEKEFQEEELFFQILDELGPPLSQSSSRKANLLGSFLPLLSLILLLLLSLYYYYHNNYVDDKDVDQLNQSINNTNFKMKNQNNRFNNLLLNTTREIGNSH